MQTRIVEKAAPALNESVSGSISHVLDVEAEVLGDGGVSSDFVSRYVYVGDVSGGGDMKLSGVDEFVCGVYSVISARVLDLWC